MQNFGGRVRCIMGDVEVVNYGIEPYKILNHKSLRLST